MNPLPKCTCGRTMISRDERERGWCSTCDVASWSPEKRAAMDQCIGLAFRKRPATEAEKDAAIDEALKHCRQAPP